MESITIALVLLLAVVLSGTLARLSPVGIPLPLVQIALGAAIAGVTGSAVQLDPHFFFLLFLPPLLFLDGWRIPKEGLFRDKAVILELALGLVVFTVILIGFLVHWMIPAIPLAVAFALAAILSPTDPIAVSAIAARVPIPGRLMHILEGESLLNDASGLVCMQFAVAAVLTGVFSLADAVGTFLWVAIGGILIGFGTTFVVMKAKYYVSRKLGEEPGAQILISLLIPFGAYLLAEHLHCSGILAAVSAGITMSFAELRGQTMAATRMRRYAVWDTVQFALNGIIFVLLGEQMPGIVSGAARIVTETGHLHPIWLIAYVAVITTALAALRFAWVWVSLRFTLYRAARRGEAIRKPHWRLLAAMSLAGVRGAITLAGILTLPLAMNDGTSFPARDLVIFLAAGVIILSLMLIRLAWRLLNPPPPLPASVPGWQQRASKLAHWGLYGMVILMAVTGYVRVRAGGFLVEMLDAIGAPALVPRSEPLAKAAQNVHFFASYVLMAMIALHLAAAAFHGLVRRDGVFSRMWPPVGR